MTTSLASAAATTTQTTADTAKGADVGTAEVKPGADAKAAATQLGSAAAVAPELFTDVKQLKLAEGLSLDEAVMKDFLPLAGKLGLNVAQAQALVEFSANGTKASEAARAEAQGAAQKAAVEALKADKEIGGAKLEASMKLAGQVLRKFGGPIDPKTGKSELTEALETMQLADGSFLGDSPVIAKLLVNIGKALAEDSVGGAVGGGDAAKTAANSEAAFLAALYPKSKTLKF